MFSFVSSSRIVHLFFLFLFFFLSSSFLIVYLFLFRRLHEPINDDAIFYCTSIGVIARDRHFYFSSRSFSFVALYLPVYLPVSSFLPVTREKKSRSPRIGIGSKRRKIMEQRYRATSVIMDRRIDVLPV